ncbi:MAG: enoyl-CoA hydratase-related protein, partial [Pseudomonadota bacterium]
MTDTAAIAPDTGVSAPVLYSVENEIATITLNRPERMNALSAEMRRLIIDALVAAPQEARVVVMTGAGAGFCAGQDLADGEAGKTAADIDLERTLAEEYEPMLRLIAECPVPV